MVKRYLRSTEEGISVMSDVWWVSQRVPCHPKHFSFVILTTDQHLIRHETERFRTEPDINQNPLDGNRAWHKSKSVGRKLERIGFTAQEEIGFEIVSCAVIYRETSRLRTLCCYANCESIGAVQHTYMLDPACGLLLCCSVAFDAIQVWLVSHSFFSGDFITFSWILYQRSIESS